MTANPLDQDKGVAGFDALLEEMRWCLERGLTVTLGEPSIRAVLGAVESLRPAAGGAAVEWPSEAKRDGADWVARTALCSHTMSEAQAKVWNACRAACMSAFRASPSHPAPASREAVGEVLWQGWYHDRRDEEAGDFDLHDLEGNPTAPCPKCVRVNIVAAAPPPQASRRCNATTCCGTPGNCQHPSLGRGVYVYPQAKPQEGEDGIRKWAQGLIEQLPGDHDGRNSWLLNHGVGAESDWLRAEHKRYSELWRDWREGYPQPQRKPNPFTPPAAPAGSGREVDDV